MKPIITLVVAAILTVTAFAAPPDPRVADLLHRARNAEFVDGDAAAALKGFEAARQADPSSGPALTGMIRTLRKLGRYDEAKARIDEVDLRTLPSATAALLRAELSNLETARKVDEVTVTVTRQSAQSRGHHDVNIDIRDCRLDDAVRMVARIAKVDCIVSPTVADRKVTVQLRKAEPGEAVQLIARAAGADAATWNGRLTVGTEAELNRMRLTDEGGTEGESKRSVVVSMRLYEAESLSGPRRLLAQPRLLVVDGQTGTIRIGNADEGGTGAERLSAQMTVTPTIVAEGKVDLRLDCSVATTRHGETSDVRQQRANVRITLTDGADTLVDMSPEGTPADRPRLLMHVVPLVVDDTTEGRQKLAATKDEARRKACTENQHVINRALDMYVGDHGAQGVTALSSLTIKQLVDEGYLSDSPVCPGDGNGPSYRLRGGRATCRVHGELERK